MYNHYLATHEVCTDWNTHNHTHTCTQDMIHHELSTPDFKLVLNYPAHMHAHTRIHTHKNTRTHARTHARMHTQEDTVTDQSDEADLTPSRLAS